MKAFELEIEYNNQVKVLYVPLFYTIKQMNQCFKIIANSFEDNELYIQGFKMDNKKIIIGNRMVYSYISKVCNFIFKNNDTIINFKYKGMKEIHGNKPFVIGTSKEQKIPLPLDNENEAFALLNYRPKKTISKSYEKRLMKVIKEFIDTNYLYYSLEDAVFKLQFDGIDDNIFVLIRKDSDELGHIDFFYSENDMLYYLNTLAMSNDTKGYFCDKITIDILDRYNKSDNECMQTMIDSFMIQVYKSTPGMNDYLINNSQALILIEALEDLLVGVKCIMQAGIQGSIDSIIGFTFDEERVLSSFDEEILNEDEFFNQFLLEDYSAISQYIDFDKTTEFYQIDIVSYEDNKKERIGRQPIKGKIILANSEICVIRDIVDFKLSSLFNQVTAMLIDTIIMNGVPETIQVNNLNMLAFISDLCLLLNLKEELSFALEYVEEAYFYEFETNESFPHELTTSLEEIKDLIENIEEDIADKKLIH